MWGHMKDSTSVKFYKLLTKKEGGSFNTLSPSILSIKSIAEILGFEIWYCPRTVSSFLTFLSSCGESLHCHQVQQKIKPMSQCSLLTWGHQEKNPDQHSSCKPPQRPPRRGARLQQRLCYNSGKLCSPFKWVSLPPLHHQPRLPLPQLERLLHYSRMVLHQSCWRAYLH